MPILSPLSRSGCCSKCHQWLGEVTEIAKKPTDLDYKYYILCGEFLGGSKSHLQNKRTMK
jgi:hypothetical protein